MITVRRAAAAGAVLLALLATSCTGTSSTGETLTDTTRNAVADWNPQGRDQLQDGGTLTSALPEFTPQANPWHSDSTANARDLWEWYNPLLTHFTPEGEFSWDRNYLLDVRETTDKGDLVITYVVEPRAKFNDGTPIDITAFKAVHAACGGTSTAHSCHTSAGYQHIKSITAGADKHEVKVRFDGMYPWWRAMFGWLLHPKAATASAFSTAYTGGNYHPEWGAGPFKIEKIDVEAGRASFVRNEKWWGDEPRLERRVFLRLEPRDTVKAFVNGDIDITGVPDEAALESVKNVEDAQVRRGSRTSWTIMMTSATSEPLGDVAVREALFRSIDRAKLAEIAFDGMQHQEQPPGSLILFPFQRGYHDNIGETMSHDVAKARQLLDTAGWASSGDGSTRMRNGKPLRVVIPLFGNVPRMQVLLENVRAMAAQVGIDVSIDPRAGSDLPNALKSGNWDVMVMRIASGDPFGPAYICQMYCTDSTLNRSGTTGSELDAQLREAEDMATAEEQTSRANILERDALQQFGIMPLYVGSHIVVARTKLANQGARVFGTVPVQNIGWQK